jgi:hypothetical protein
MKRQGNTRASLCSVWSLGFSRLRVRKETALEKSTRLSPAKFRRLNPGLHTKGSLLRENDAFGVRVTHQLNCRF